MGSVTTAHPNLRAEGSPTGLCEETPCRASDGAATARLNKRGIQQSLPKRPIGFWKVLCFHPIRMSNPGVREATTTCSGPVARLLFLIIGRAVGWLCPTSHRRRWPMKQTLFLLPSIVMGDHDEPYPVDWRKDKADESLR